MLKTTIIAIMCLMISLSAGATKLVITHEDFVLLTDAEKDQYIIKLMELSVELESRYARETAQYGYSSERFERYKKILTQLKSALFIPDAYAAPSPRGGSSSSPTFRGGGVVKAPSRAAVKNKRSWEEMANDWNKLLSEKRDGKDTCIFAGWISRAVTINGKPTCTHPDFIDGDGPNRHVKPGGIIARESFAYPEPVAGSNCGKDDKTMIQCNPLIFGYKKEASKALLCVKAGDDSHNSSFNCMKAALKTEGVNEAEQDLPAKRLKFLRDKFSDSKNAQLFKDVWGFTFKTCLCPTVAADSKGNKTFSQGYQEYMRPHQTCYGLMEMMAETSSSCTPQDKFPMSDTTIFKKLQDMIKRTGLSESQAKDQYTSFLTSVKRDNPNEYKAVCGDVPGLVVTPKEEVPVTPVVVKEDEPVVVVTPKKDPKYACEAKCESTVIGASLTADDNVTETNTTARTEYTCSFTVKDENDAAASVKFDTDPTEKPTKPEDKNLSVTNKIAGKDVTLSCNLAITPKAVTPVVTNTDPDPTLTTTITCQERTCKITAVPSEKHEGWAVKWNIKNPPQGESIVKDWEMTTDPKPTVLPGQVQDPAVKPESTPAADKLEITQSKGKVEYEVCATLEKGDKKIPTDGSCQKVPALTEAPKPTPKPAPVTGGPNGVPQPPQVQIRGSSDTSAIGIR